MIAFPGATWLTVLLETTLNLSIVLAFVLLARSLVMRKAGSSFAYALWILPGIRLCLPEFGIDLFSSIWQGHVQALTTLGRAEPVGFSLMTMKDANVQPVMNEVGPWHALAELGIAPLLMGTWAMGFLGLVVYQLIQHRNFLVEIRRQSVSITPSLLATSNKIRKELGLRRGPKICVSSACKGPMVTGLWHPLIVVPAHFEIRFSHEEQTIALTHEMMHIKRGDLWALQVASWVVAFQWFNPLAWIALRCLRLDQEAACDASVLKNPSISPYLYGSILVKAAKLHAGFSLKRMAQLSFAHMLKARLRALQKPVLSPIRMRINGALLGLGCLTLLFITGFGNADVKKAPEFSHAKPYPDITDGSPLNASVGAPIKGLDGFESEKPEKGNELQPQGFMTEEERRAIEMSVEQAVANPWAPHPSAEARDRFERDAERGK